MPLLEPTEAQMPSSPTLQGQVREQERDSSRMGSNLQCGISRTISLTVRDRYVE